jgi:DNA-binding Xre family transcriptional regulator
MTLEKLVSICVAMDCTTNDISALLTDNMEEK